MKLSKLVVVQYVLAIFGGCKSNSPHISMGQRLFVTTLRANFASNQ